MQPDCFSPGTSSKAWSHGLGSGKASKDSLEKTLLNSRRWSGIPSTSAECSAGGRAALEFRLNASASLWEMVEDQLEVARTSSGVLCRVVTKIRSPSSNSGGVSSSSSSSTRVGSLPSEQREMCQAFSLCSFRSVRILSRQPEQQLPEQQDIFTSPVLQSMSGLCFCNQEWPMITF